MEQCIPTVISFSSSSSPAVSSSNFILGYSEALFVAVLFLGNPSPGLSPAACFGRSFAGDTAINTSVNPFPWVVSMYLFVGMLCVMLFALGVHKCKGNGALARKEQYNVPFPAAL